jgi:hypothetical protein
MKFLKDTVSVSMQMKTTRVGLTSLLNDVISDTTKLTDDIDFDIYMKNYSPSGFQKEFEEYLSQMFKNSDQIEEPVENLKKIVSQIKEAVDQNGFNGDILGKIENAIHIIMKETSKNKDENDLTYLAKSYTDLLDILDLAV